MRIQLDLWWRDLRLACRNAARRPGFTLLVVVTLALGIGVNSAMFALVDAVLLRSLPYEDPGRLVFLWQTLPAHNIFELEATPADYTAWQRVGSFDKLGMIATGSFTLTGGSQEPERVQGTRTTATLLPLLGISPRLGRTFLADEDTDAAPPVVILSDGLWRRRFGSDPGVVGRAIEIDRTPHTVVGVMPPAAALPGRFGQYEALWLPARMAGGERTNAISHNYTVIGRLAPHATVASASAELATFETNAHPGRAIGARVSAVSEDSIRAIKPALLLLTAGVALLLLIASANVATLLLARASNLRRDAAVRAALGATRGRLASLAVTESVVLACLGAIAGLTLGAWTLKGLLPAFAGSLPRIATVEVGARVALFTIGIALGLGVVFGLAVAGQKPADALAAELKSGTRSAGTPGTRRSRRVLVVAQIALAVVLLSTAGLMIKSFVRLQHVNPGFSTERLLTFRLGLPDTGYAAPAARRAFVDDIVQRLNGAGEVTRAAVNSALPLGGSFAGNSIAVEGRPTVPGELTIVGSREITPDYFNAMTIPLVGGRGFTARDDAAAEQVVVISRTMARQLWPNSNPINQRVRINGGPQSADGWLRIVGIVGDVHHNGLARPPAAEMYRPFAQRPTPDFAVVVRTAGDPAAMVPEVRARLQQIDPNLPMYDIRTMEERVAASIAEARAIALLLLFSAALAAALAAVAIYGSIWYAVSQRIPEIGIRLALGASRLSVCRHVMGGALWSTAAGTAIGVAAALASGPLVRGLLFDTPPADPATYAAVIVCLMGLTAAASVLPARRAMSVDPLIALRSE